MTQRRIYQNEFPYFITFRTREGYLLFEDGEMAGMMARVIFKTCHMKQFEVMAFQIMPDHVHLLINQKYTAPTAGCGGRIRNIPRAQPAVVARPSKIFTISDMIHGIKSYYCAQIRDQYGINYPIFQKRFYTRIIDTDEYLRTIIQYIQHNPIKAEQPKKCSHMPY